MYAYDQLERLAIIERAIEPLREIAETALDFGCGSGDFSSLLLRSGLRVWGYDPYVKPEIDTEGFSYLSSPDAVADMPAQVDIIVSITVLDHILDEGELLDVLRLLRRKVSADGTFLLIEYAFDGLNTRPRSDYQALRQLGDWRNQLDASGWTVVSTHPVPTVPESPSPGYLAFQGSPWVRLLRRIANRGGLGTDWAKSFLRRRATRVFRNHGLGKVEHSPLKLLICRPIPEQKGSHSE